ncbi:methionyl aminopeptidase [Malassezia sp. CBS 17886]|nr:methionyl aminopeptidase [Malassezia sp. CBS 17886]
MDSSSSARPDAGSKQNWRSLAKAMAQRFHVPIYTLDLRNHGTSPHSDTMTYVDMAEDVRRFIDDHHLSNLALVGHSLGGKVAMAVALDPTLRTGTLSHLVSVDMSPAAGPISPEFMEYARCMLDIEKAQVHSRHEADEMLQKVEPNLAVRQFLLTNLDRDRPGEPMRFRIPVASMMKSLGEVGKFPYINRRNLAICNAFFPSMRVVSMPTGHWCQSEDPALFQRLLHDFLVGRALPEWTPAGGGSGKAGV